MVIVVGLATVGVYLALGPDRAFKPDTFEPSTIWLIACFAFSFIAAVAGGFVCSRISGPGATRVLAGLVLVLGILMALPAMNVAGDTRPTVRLADTPSLVAMQNQRQPPWAAMSFPLIGAVGVLIGGSRKRS